MAGTKQDAQAFVERWRGRGSEEQDGRTYWIDLFQTVLGVDDALERLCFEQPVETKAGNGTSGRMDVLIPSARVLIEQKSLGTDLDRPEERQGRMVTPAEQAHDYAEALPLDQQPRYVVTSNFQTIRVYDRYKDALCRKPQLELALEKLPENLSALQFLKGTGEGHLVRQREVSEEAGRIMGRIHADVAALYHDPDSPDAHHALAVFCTRIMFLMYAEDSGIIERGLFQEYVAANDAPHLREALLELFRWLDTPPKERAREYPDPLRARFPYMDGGLFREQIELPQLSEDARYEILVSGCQELNWNDVDPTVFGSIFEGALSHDERRAGGMHYTSPENIHKVIDPLFLDELTDELDHILEEPSPSVRTRRLKAYHQKLGSLAFLDPACGSGNFLTETYTCVRRLENRVLVALSETGRNAGQGSIDYGGEGTGESQVLVSLDHFRGIELNDYACCVAQTALLIAERQADQATERAGVARVNDPLPLEDYQGIACGNALTMDWNDVLPASKCSYVLGNPPFVGYSRLNESQKADRARVFGSKGGTLDYVACWYKKAADYTRGTHARCAFVSTNSICQGQQVSPLWRPLAEDGVGIDFAHDTFRWDSLADDEAHVHVVVVGFSREGGGRTLYHHERLSAEAEVSHPVHINGYLKAAPDAFITRRAKPLCTAPEMAMGFKPADHGNLLLSPEERDDLLEREPEAARWVRRFSMGQEYIHGEERWCLWLEGITPAELNALPLVKGRVDACRKWRMRQKETGDAYKLRDTPHLFRPCGKFMDGTYVAIPEVSSERRRYVPMGFISDGMIPGNQVYFVSGAALYHFGVLTSGVHNAWMRTVAGRLEMRYRYSNTVVYNNFVWPGCETKDDLATPAEELVPGTIREKIEGLAQEVLAARESYAPATLADLYDPDDAWMYPRLMQAHEALDAAVEEAYGLSPGTPEDELTAHLFELYDRLAG